MCAECGCEAVPVIEALMVDHAAMAARAGRIESALQNDQPMLAARLTAELAGLLSHHLDVEVAGLFEQLQVAGVAGGWVDELIVQGRRLLDVLRSPDAVADPTKLRATLTDLIRYGEAQDHELFPYALATLPWVRWGLVEAVHQRFLTV